MKMRHINTAFFTPDNRGELASLLPVSMRVNGLDDQFIDATELATERVKANRPKIDATKVATKRAKAKTVRTRFQEIDNAVTALKTEMWELIGEPRQLNDAQYKTLAAAAALETKDLGSARELLSRMRGDLGTLHKWCSTVVTTIEPDKADKTSKRWARWLTIEVATAYRNLYGELPTTQRSTWFPDFMDSAGKLAGVRIGRVIVEQAIKTLQAQHV